jgi:hypothetical protein
MQALLGEELAKVTGDHLDQWPPAEFQRVGFAMPG